MEKGKLENVSEESEARETEKADSSVKRAKTVRELKEVDAEILRLIELRAALTVSEVSGSSVGSAVPASSAVKGRKKKELVPAARKEEILRDIRSLCEMLVRPKKVAFLGPLYSFTHQAALKFFGRGLDFVPVSTIGAVFEEVERKRCDFGVVPVENSTDGRVVDALETFTHAKVQICGEVDLPIHHTLMGNGTLAEVRTVFSKPQAISQCRHWLAKHLPNVRFEETGSTAAAAQIVRNQPGAAAIASILAAQANDLKVLANEIEDSKSNVTRFVVLGAEDAPKSAKNKTMLMFELLHEVGALADAMAIFKRNRINLTWIESFPVPQEHGKYLFFVDLEGHRTQMKVRRAIAALEKKSARLVVLGSYPAK